MTPDLSINFCGIHAPNPFWLASAPPTNSGFRLRRGAMQSFKSSNSRS